MNNKSLLIGLFAIAVMSNNYVLSMGKDKFIPDASYYIFEGNGECESSGSMPCSSKYATFYTFDGTELAMVAHPRLFDCNFLNKLLDPNAPKPQPTSCLIKWWPAISLGFGLKKGMPGWFINFLDKNGNNVGRYRYDRETHEITMNRGGGWVGYHFDESNPQSIDPNISLEKLHLDLSKLSKVRIEELKNTHWWWPW